MVSRTVVRPVVPVVAVSVAEGLALLETITDLVRAAAAAAAAVGMFGQVPHSHMFGPARETVLYL